MRVIRLPPGQHELDRTDQESLCPERSTVDHEVGIDDLPEVSNTYIRSLVVVFVVILCENRVSDRR